MMPKLYRFPVHVYQSTLIIALVALSTSIFLSQIVIPPFRMTAPLQQHSFSGAIDILSHTGLMSSPTPTPTLTFVVTTLQDSDRATCAPGDCSLREAIKDAPDGTHITFAPGLSGTISMSPGLYDSYNISKNLTIIGPGARTLAISGGNTHLFIIGESGAASVTISGLTLQNGNVFSGSGGAIYVASRGRLRLQAVHLIGNRVEGGSDNYYGGAIYNLGNVRIDQSLLANNSVTSSNVIARSLQGGAIYNAGTMLVTNSTFFNNKVSNQSTGLARGGAISNDGPQGTLTIINSTFANNLASEAGGSIYDQNSRIDLQNTVIGGGQAPRGPDIFGTVNSQGNNLIQNPDDAGIVGNMDTTLTWLNPKLGILGNYGGPTDTMPLGPGSPAIDTGNAGRCAGEQIGNIDQRGVLRPIDGNQDGLAICDMGAYEAQNTVNIEPTYTPTFTPTPVYSTVNTLLDLNNDTCTVTTCSLRDAIAVVPNGGVVRFAPDLAGTIVLDSTININKLLTIEGTGSQNITLSASGNFSHLLYVREYAEMTLKKVSVTNAVTPIFNKGRTTLIEVDVHHNRGLYGAAVTNWEGQMVILNSALRDNYGANFSRGGGYYSMSGTGVIVNTTIANNSVDYSGGGVYAGAALMIINSTIANNRARYPDANIINNIDSNVGVTLRNSIVQNIYSGVNCYGSIINGGNNLQYADGTCGSIPNIDPKLGVLTNNGGDTLTMMLASDSPAIDMGDNTLCADVLVNDRDQRGYQRPVDANGDGVAVCDIGSVEASAGTSQPTATPTASDTPTMTAIPPVSDTIGVYRDGVWHLRTTNTAGAAEIVQVFGGDPSDLPVVGDWNGDGIDTLGIYRSNVGVFYLSDSNTAPSLAHTLIFGNPDDIPFAGKWSNDMIGDGVGVYRNSNGILYQKKSLTTGFSDFFAIFGNPGDIPIAGDFDGDGYDSIGIYRVDTGSWYLTDNSQPNGITFSNANFAWDIGRSRPIAGDWDGNGRTTVGYQSLSGVFVLHSTTATNGTDIVFAFGPLTGRPVAGKWGSPSRAPSPNGVIVGLSGAYREDEPGANAD
jgi:CSLREA domain-containing protein